MDTLNMATSSFSFLLLPLLLLLPSTSTSTTLQILHPFSPSSPHHHHLPLTPTSLSLLSSSSLFPSPSTSPSRRRHLRHSWAPVASGASILSTPSYLVSASLGSPPQPLLLSLQTSYDTSWIPSSSFHPSKSSSFSHSRRTPLRLHYGPSTLHASLSRDTLHIAGDSHPSFSFALVTSSSPSFPPQGLLGLGRGRLSFLSQTRHSYRSVFSYCLPSYRSANFSGTLRLGHKGQPVHIKTTQLLHNPHRPSLYYVPMTGIRVGSKYLHIPKSAFAFNPRTGAGTVFNSGTLFTRLVAPAYVALRDEFRRRVGRGRPVTKLGGFDTCYHGVDDRHLPTVSFHFKGGIFVTLPKENVVIRSSAGRTVCLAMAASPAGGVDRVLNIIAGWQQQNHRVLIDVHHGKVGVSREDCTG